MTDPWLKLCRALLLVSLGVVLMVTLPAAATAYLLTTGTGTGSMIVGTLSAPSINTASPGAGTVSLSWSAVQPPATGAVSYYVQRNGADAGGNCPVSSSPTAVTSCVDAGLTAGNYQYTVTAVWRTWTATSSTRTVTIASGAVDHFVLTAATTTPTAGAADNLTITAKDAANNTVTAYTGAHNLTFSGARAAPDGSHNPTVANSSGVAVNFGSTTAIGFSSGVATVSGSSNGTMTLYRAEIADVVVSDGTISNGGGLPVTVTAASVAELAFTQQPTGSTGGVAFGTQPVVAVEDAYGNAITADTSSVTLAITSGTGTSGATLSCTTNPLAASSGVAGFAGCKIDKAGTGYTLTATDGSLTAATSNSFTITVGSAAKLAFTQQPSGSTGGVAFGTQPTVAVEDAAGNVITTNSSSVTLAITGGTGTSGATLSCTTNPLAASSGVAGFAGCKIDKAGTGYTLTATDGSLTAATSNSFTITVGSAAKLAFTQQPSGSTGGVAFGTQPTVAVEDAAGNVITTNSSSVTLAITSGTGTSGATLSCTTNPLAASSGVAGFAGCKIDKAGTGYTLTATDGSLTAATSNSFTITVGSAAKLAFTQQPSGSTGGVAFGTQPTVAVEDAAGNVITTNSSSVTLAITSGTGTSGATLSCTTNPLAASSGVAGFAGCKIDKAGTGYTLTATDGSLTAATSNSFTITAPPIAWVASGAVVTRTSAGSLAPTIPSGLSVNYLMIAIVANTTGNVSSAPTGWTSAATISTNAGAGISLSIFYRLFQTGDTAPSITVNTDGGGASAQIVAFDNVNTTTPLDVASVTSTSAAGSSTFTPTGLTTATANARAESIIAENPGSNTAPTLSFSNAQGFSAESGFPDKPAVSGGNNSHAVDVAGKAIASAGAVTFPTFATSAAGVWAGVSIALRP